MKRIFWQGSIKNENTQFKSLIVTRIDCQVIFPQFNLLYGTVNKNSQIQASDKTGTFLSL